MVKRLDSGVVMLLVQAGDTVELEKIDEKGIQCVKIIWPDSIGVSDVFSHLSQWLRENGNVSEVKILVHQSHDNELLIPRLIGMQEKISEITPCELVALNENIQQQILTFSVSQPISLYSSHVN